MYECFFNPFLTYDSTLLSLLIEKHLIYLNNDSVHKASFSVPELSEIWILLWSLLEPLSLCCSLEIIVFSELGALALMEMKKNDNEHRC